MLLTPRHRKNLSLCHKEPAKDKKAPSRGLWVPWAGSLWHKRAGVASLSTTRKFFLCMNPPIIDSFRAWTHPWTHPWTHGPTWSHSELFSLTRLAGHQAPPPLSVPSRPFSAPTLEEEKLELELSWLSLIPPELRPSGDWQPDRPGNSLLYSDTKTFTVYHCGWIYLNLQMISIRPIEGLRGSVYRGDWSRSVADLIQFIQ